MQTHPVRKFMAVSVTLPLHEAEALAAALNRAGRVTRPVQSLRRSLNTSLRSVGWIKRLEGQAARRA